MKQQLTMAALFVSVLMLPMIPVSADNPEVDYDNGNTVFSWLGTANTVELIGEWNWSEVTTMNEESGVWSAELDLDEGIYCYKFIVNGEFIYDPANPYRGFCGDVENSVVRVKNSSRPKMNLKEQFLYNLMVCRSKIFNLLPNYIKLKFKKL